jgi:hypothetical protein
MSEPFNFSQELIKILRKCNEGTNPIMGDIAEIDGWRNVAMKIGEKLSSTGPDDYYNFTPEQWFEWANSQIEKSNQIKIAKDVMKQDSEPLKNLSK